MLDRLASVLERRFLLNAFVPLGLYFGGYVWLLEWAMGRLGHDIRVWESSPFPTKALIAAGFFGLIWFFAGFLSNQWRNLIRLYEGYLFRGPAKGLGRLGIEAHRARRLGMVAAGRLTYFDYPRRAKDILPTRLGNVLRAAEHYPMDRYGADYPLLWTRLGHVVPERVLRDMEDYRSALEFLVVATSGFATFGILAAATCAATGHGPTPFLLFLLGGCVLAYIAYSSAIHTAQEYGEAMRASFDLFRNELLVRMRWPVPTTPEEEIVIWREITGFIGADAGREHPYSHAWVDLDPERFR